MIMDWKATNAVCRYARLIAHPFAAVGSLAVGVMVVPSL